MKPPSDIEIHQCATRAARAFVRKNPSLKSYEDDFAQEAWLRANLIKKQWDPDRSKFQSFVWRPMRWAILSYIGRRAAQVHLLEPPLPSTLSSAFERRYILELFEIIRATRLRDLQGTAFPVAQTKLEMGVISAVVEGATSGEAAQENGLAASRGAPIMKRLQPTLQKIIKESSP